MKAGRKITPPHAARPALAQTDPLLPPDAAAAYLGLAEQTLANWRSARHPERFISFVKIGGAVRYRKSVLDAVIARGEVTA